MLRISEKDFLNGKQIVNQGDMSMFKQSNSKFQNCYKDCI